MIISATGHRPNKLGGYADAVLEIQVGLAEGYLKKRRPKEVISGLALGWDTAWAIAAIKLDLPVIAAIPFSGQESMWPAASKQRYLLIKSLCDKVKIVSEGAYAPWKMQVRNKWMVDNSDRVAALWDGSSGGTGNCVAYAQSVARPIDNLWTQYQKLRGV